MSNIPGQKGVSDFPLTLAFSWLTDLCPAFWTSQLLRISPLMRFTPWIKTENKQKGRVSRSIKNSQCSVSWDTCRHLSRKFTMVHSDWKVVMWKISPNSAGTLDTLFSLENWLIPRIRRFAYSHHIFQWLSFCLCRRWASWWLFNVCVFCCVVDKREEDCSSYISN